MNIKDNFIFLKAFTKEDFTDKKILSFRYNHANFSFQEYDDFLESIVIESDNSKKIINFFVNYHNGCLCPDKCDAYEPIRENFYPDDIFLPVKWLSQPGSAFYFKRTKDNLKFEGSIENHRFTPIWEQKNGQPKLLQPIVPEPELLGEIKLWFDKKNLSKNDKDIKFVEQVLKNIDNVIKIEEYNIYT